MDSDKRSAQIERLEVVETGRRRAGPRTRSSRSCWRACRRRARSRRRSAPLLAELEAWLRAQLSRSSGVIKPIDYLLKRWSDFARFTEDGRICLTTDGVEKRESSHGGSWGLFLPCPDHLLVGPFGTCDILHLAMPYFFDPIVMAGTGLAVLA